MIKDNVGAFMPDLQFIIEPYNSGILDGLTFAVKDLFHIKGYKTSAGNPTWLKTHDICQETSPVVVALLDNGAKCIGKVLTDEMAYSLNGDNIHYGTPINVNALGRITGGSSNGSAAAVAAKLCDFALATDTGGSTRVPASYCGLYGIRSTHGLISAKHMVPLHPSFDTVNWLANDFDIFRKVGDVLCQGLQANSHNFKKVIISPTLFGLADEDFQPALTKITDILCQILATQAEKCSITLGEETLDDWRQAYVDAGAFEVWSLHGAWVEKYHPTFSTPIRQRFDFAKGINKAQSDNAWQFIAKIKEHMDHIITNDTVMVLPSSATIAPPLESEGEIVNAARIRLLQMTCVASLTGLPQVSIPLKNKDNMPLGISLLGPKNSDLALIKLAGLIVEKLA